MIYMLCRNRVVGFDRFISDPEADKAGEISGVIDGEIHFVEDAEGDS